MNVMVDLNIFLDVFQNRKPHYSHSSKILSKVLNRELTGVVASHMITTLYYLTSRFSGKTRALEIIDWLLEHFEVEGADKESFLQSRSFHMKDFEDAVVASCAKNSNCDYIITRNISDFKTSPVPALLPNDFLQMC